MEELGLDQTQKPPLFTINVTARTLYAFHQVQLALLCPSDNEDQVELPNLTSVCVCAWL
jgi:hypothetical protein